MIWNDHQDEKSNSCPECKNYARKIKEIEVIKSGSDAIIEALQNQLKRCETNYINLYDKFEKLRFEHNTATCQNFSLKEINNKFKEQLCKNEQKSNENNEPEPFSICLRKSQIICQSKPQTQDKEVITSNRVAEFNTVESGDFLLEKSETNYQKQTIICLNQLLEKYKEENQRMISLLHRKDDEFTDCSCTPDFSVYTDTMDSSKNFGSALESRTLGMMKTQQSVTLCKCTVLNHLNDVTNSNQRLSDTLGIITAENKNNLQNVVQLKEELKKLNEECDHRCDALKNQLHETENELDNYRLKEKKLKETINALNAEAQNMTDKLEKLMEDNSRLNDCRCNADITYMEKIAELEGTINDMRRELMEKVTQISHVDEEHEVLCRNIGILTDQNFDLSKKLKILEHELQEATKQPVKCDVGNQVSNTELPRLVKENEVLKNDLLKANQALDAKIKEADDLRSHLGDQLNEMQTINEENENLKKEIERIKKENGAETAKLQGMVEHSQNQVAVLLKEHDAKTKQIQSVANQLDNIRRSATEENNVFLQKIQQLEKEKQQLLDQLKQRKDCKCENTREEIERLRMELTRKQCTIAELEDTMDNFNKTMEQFDEDLKKLVCENECLKKERAGHNNRVQDLQQQLEKATKESAKMNDPSGKNCPMCIDEKRRLQELNDNLKKQLTKVAADNDVAMRELNAEKLQMELEVENARNCSKRLSMVSAERLRNLQTAYDELKAQYDSKVSENDALAKERSKYQQIANVEKSNRASLVQDTEALQNLRRSHEELKRIYAAKCIESEELRQQYEKAKRQSNVANLTKSMENEGKLQDLQKNYDVKCQEVKKLKKQCDVTCKQAQISRDEYNNLRKEYKDIKSMLSEQIKKCRPDVNDSSNGKRERKCGMMEAVTQRWKEKEKEVNSLQQKLQDASYEVIELKDYIHKLTSDNNILKSAINNLIINLERKIKGSPCVQGNSVECIAGEILNSLTNIETSIVKCSTCPMKECNCMVEICSQYNMQAGPSQQNNQRCLGGCVENPCICVDVKDAGTMKTVTESSTTDSEDCQCAHFLDSASLNFLKQTIQELKSKKDSTMKEKSCDCEQLI
ncbi:hypothetical protein GWI33_007874 [Rhynchophorus ferrugineus]|uniref:Uncharacterized protein n=1 Tax=Rhynchophorus ferrugineus TaxID=354439 RepID=A0A834MEJ2_RHYFE|nr:hypothetical protein GWI33_007874 [Rhynchophorus ferrugineus]